MRRQLLTGLRMVVVMIVLVGLAYPLVVTGVSQAFFGHRANGSLVTVNGKPVGSSLLGQTFDDAAGHPDPRYFQPRPSATANGERPYDPTASGGSNLGPSNQTLVDKVTRRVAAYRALNGLASDQAVPVDAVTASASGLDPDISIANARLQIARVAGARALSVDTVSRIVDAHIHHRPFDVLGEDTVNVLDLNLALDQRR